MKIYLGFDDTDTVDAPFGTGKLVRWFLPSLPDGCTVHGVVRQQLLVHEDIPYTSHNSSACIIADIADYDLIEKIVELAVAHIETHSVAGSDPGLCLAAEGDPSLGALIDFGYRCTQKVTSQKEALKAVGSVYLSGHGGTNDGIIGAAAGVGLTASGWAGRYIECGNLRSFPEEITVAELRRNNIEVVAMDRDANLPAPEATVKTNNWLRPRHLGHKPVVLVTTNGAGVWHNIYAKRHKSGKTVSHLSPNAM
jgi:hypothetical protein